MLDQLHIYVYKVDYTYVVLMLGDDSTIEFPPDPFIFEKNRKDINI